MRRLILWIGFSSAVLAGDVSLTVAGIRVMPERWNKQANFAKLERWAREAAGKGADLVVAPEGFLEGYVGNDKSNPGLTRESYFEVGEPLDGELMTSVRNLARELTIYLSVGFAERRGGRMYNSSVIFSPRGERVSLYSKSHNNDDEPYNTKGDAFPVPETPLGRWGTLICFDRQLPETARILAVKGAQLILVPSYGMWGETNDIMMRTRALENSVWVVFVHPRRCLIVDPGGKVVASDDGGGDQLVTARISLDSRVGRGPIRFRRPEIYGDLIKK
jgi:predicted amidohydrolase